MQLHVKMILTTLIFLVITALVVIFLTLKSDYKYNDVSLTGAGALDLQLLEDLSLSDEYYIFTTNMVLEKKLEAHSYIDSYSFEKEMPNHVRITVTTNEPILCDTDYLYFEANRVPRSTGVETLCDNVPILIGTSPNIELLTKAIHALNSETINQILEVVFVQETELKVVMKKNEVLLYLEDVSWLNNYTRFDPNSAVLDLRKNYS